MKRQFIAFLILSAWALGVGYTAVAQSFKDDTPQRTVPVTIVVSVDAKHGTEIPVIYREDVRVFHGQNRLKVTEWEPLRADRAGLELFILVDDACATSIGSNLEDLRKFIREQSDATTVGVGYIANNTVQIVQNLTKDHGQAVKALRMPLGLPAAYSSPYLAVTSLLEGWQKTANRRAIFLVSPGIDGLQPGPSNSYLQGAIEHAQRANIEVYAIYGSAAGRAGRSFWRLNFGQSNLSQLAEETGGEAYFQGSQTPLSFAPFLDQFGDRLQHQYSLTFLANAGDKVSDQRIRLETEVSNAELIGPDTVRIPAFR
jgi:hypothetical protein